MRDALAFPMSVSERISFLYFERTVLERCGHSLVAITGSDRVQIPVGRTSVIMLGPGVTVTHAAISLCSLEGALVLWVGEAAVRLYGYGNPRSNADTLLYQASLRLDDGHRVEVARRIFSMMFSEEPPQRRSIEQLRGIEGARVKQIYANLAQQYKVRWEGRSSDMSDPLNAAISTATSALYGVTEAAILALGFSPAIGFVHSGDPRSFVFDIADTVKFKSVVPLAFDLVAKSAHQLEQRTRAACRDLFYREQVPAQIVAIVKEVLGANVDD